MCVCLTISLPYVLEQEKYFLQNGRHTLIRNVYYWHWCFSRGMSNLYIHFVVSYLCYLQYILDQPEYFSGWKVDKNFPIYFLLWKMQLHEKAYCITKPSIFFWFVWLFCNEIKSLRQYLTWFLYFSMKRVLWTW